MSREERLAKYREKVDPKEAADRVEAMAGDPKIKAWMRRFRKLMREQPPETWIYWQEDTMNLMALSPEGHRYVHGENDGSDQAAVIDLQMVPGSDAGGW